MALQFHLESTKDSVKQMIKHCADELTDGKYIQTPEEMLSKDSNFASINDVMNWVFNSFYN